MKYTLNKSVVLTSTQFIAQIYTLLIMLINFGTFLGIFLIWDMGISFLSVASYMAF
jgi:hypothetical protein